VAQLAIKLRKLMLHNCSDHYQVLHAAQWEMSEATVFCGVDDRLL